MCIQTCEHGKSDEDQYLPSESFVNRFKLTIESHDQDHKNILVNQFARDGDAEKRFGAHDVIGRRCGVSMHKRSTGNYT
jgi:hypothetical protein